MDFWTRWISDPSIHVNHASWAKWPGHRSKVSLNGSRTYWESYIQMCVDQWAYRHAMVIVTSPPSPMTWVDTDISIRWNTSLKHLKILKNFKVKLKIILTIKSSTSDRGGEYLSFEFGTHLKSCGIVPQLTPAGTPQRNGVSERRNRTLLDSVRSLMSLTNLLVSFRLCVRNNRIHFK